MCGIVGMTALADISQATVQRLAALEYRGYDSYGVATMSDGAITVQKDVGSINSALREGRLATLPPSTLALGHTRWATHGRVSSDNAHPHLSYDSRIAIVHNGVIANHAQLRERLANDGIPLRSETDSEVIAHLIAQRVEHGATLVDAIFSMTAAVRGEYSVAIIASSDPTTVYGVRNKSPLVACYDRRQAILASDQLAFAGVRDGQILFLHDGDLILLRRDSAQILVPGPDGRPTVAERESITFTETPDAVTKEGFPHYMIKEIHETPSAADRANRTSLHEVAGMIPASSRPVLLFGSGSGFYVAQIGQYLLTQFAGTSAIALPSDEAAAFMSLQSGDPAIAISQSGETFDTLEMCRAAIELGATVTSITNVPHSTLERLARHRLRQGCGPEISVLSTKSIISQVVILARLAFKIGQRNETLSAHEHARCMQSLIALPEALNQCIGAVTPHLRRLAQKYADIAHWFFIGRGILYPVAMESALKFKEGTYRHAEGVSAGMFKHGVIPLVGRGFHTIALLPPADPNGPQHAATLATVSEIAARGGKVTGWGFTSSQDRNATFFSDYVSLPRSGNELTDAALQLVTGQLFAYYYALNLGREIDQPRHLAKSVTVR